MSILDIILQGMQGTNAAAPLASQNPGISLAMAPETPAITAPGAGPGASLPVPPSVVPQHRGGILGALGRVFTPQAGTFWDSAWKNGLMGARSGQQEYAQAQQRQALADQLAAAKATTENRKSRFSVAGNNIVDYGDGTSAPTIIQPSPQEDAKERLIDKWHEARDKGDKLTMGLLERAIGGAQYSPEVIAAMGDARTRTVVAGKKAQRFAPKSGGSRGGGGVTLPAGAVVIK